VRARFSFLEDAACLATCKIAAVWKDDTELEDSREVKEVNPEFYINWL